MTTNRIEMESWKHLFLLRLDTYMNGVPTLFDSCRNEAGRADECIGEAVLGELYYLSSSTITKLVQAELSDLAKSNPTFASLLTEQLHDPWQRVSVHASTAAVSNGVIHAQNVTAFRRDSNAARLHQAATMEHCADFQIPTHQRMVSAPSPSECMSSNDGSSSLDSVNVSNFA